MTGSFEPTKLTQVTAALSLLLPSTATVNIVGGAMEVCEVSDDVMDDVSEDVREGERSERRQGEKEMAEEGIWRERTQRVKSWSRDLQPIRSFKSVT